MITPHNRHRRSGLRRVLTLLTITLAVGGIGWSTWMSSRPSVEEAIALADAGRFDQAEAKALDCLSPYHSNDAVHLLLAQIVLKRAEVLSAQDPELRSKSALLALDHLSRVHPYNPRMSMLFHVSMGNALERLQRLDGAEVAWLDALRISPAAPEAGLKLFNLYYVLGRGADARRIANQLLPRQNDANDRAMILLELIRPDVRPPAPASLIKLLEPVVLRNPGDLQSAMALGLALTRSGQLEEGIDQIRRVIQNHPDHIDARDGLLTALEESGQIVLMGAELERLPTAVAESPRLLKYRARLAQDSNRWSDAVDLYRQALIAEPNNRSVQYRLARLLRQTGRSEEADRIDQRIRRRDAALKELPPLFERALETADMGTCPDTQLCQRIADVRERMQLVEEARGWHRVVLGNEPENELSRAAVVRLEKENGPQ